MADVEMTDAPTGTKVAKAGAGTDVAADGKKRFEVKKVGSLPSTRRQQHE